MREEELFAAVLEKPPVEREAYLCEACGDDEALRKRVEVLVQSYEEAGEFLDEPLAASPRTILDSEALEPDPRSSDLGAEKQGDKVGPYKLLQQIGEGGFGVVWMAEQTAPITRKVALKVIKAGMDTGEVLARFEAERQALAMMDHTNIAKVLDAGATEQGRPYFVMELVKGIPITKFCDEQKFTTRERLALFQDVCAAVNHAHQKGVIHRDLKPQNVMVTLHGDKPVVKVIDFGIAKATQSKLTDRTLFTRFEQFLGTPAYMSPEQASLSGLDVDTRSDIYALGVLLYELLAGRPPFDPKTLVSAGHEEMRRIIREEEPPRPSHRLSTMAGEEATRIASAHRTEAPKLGRQLRGDLDWIVMRAIEKDRTRRYETANAFAADIGRFLGDEPVFAAAPSMTYRFKKFARRNKAALGVAAGFALVLISATAVSSWQAWEATQARKQSEKDRQAEEMARDDAEVARAKAEAATELAEDQAKTIRRNLYISEMKSAVQASEQDEGLPELMRITDSWLPTGNEEDLRGWEWYFLRSAAQNESDSVQIQGGTISDIAVSPDDSKVAVCTVQGTIQVLDPTLENVLLAVHHTRARSVSWSPDGDRFICVGTGPSIRLFDAETGNEVWAVEAPFVRKVSWSHSGDRIAVGFRSARPNPVTILDASTGETVRLIGESRGVRDIAWRPGDKELAVADHFGGSSILNVETGQPVFHFNPNAERILTLAWSPDGTRFAFAGMDQIVWVYDATTGHQVHELRHALDLIEDLAWSPDGSAIASTSGLGILVWDARRGTAPRTLRGHRDRTEAVTWSPDGKNLYSGDRGGVLRKWKLDQLGLATTVMTAEKPIEEIAWNPDGRLLASASWDGFVRVVDVHRKELEWEHHAHPAEVRGASGVSWSPDGTRLATGGWDGRLHLWNYATRTSQFFSDTGRKRVCDVILAPGGDRLIASYHKKMRAWDLSSGTIEYELPLRREWHYQQTPSMSPSGRLIAIPAAQRVEIRPSNGGEPLWIFPGGHKAVKEEIIGYAWSPDETRLAMARADGIVIWNLEDDPGPMILSGHAEEVMDVDWSPDGTRLVSAGKDTTCRIWDPVTGTQLLVLREHKNRVHAVEWSPDGQKFASASADGTVKIWDGSKGYAEQGESPGPRLLPVPLERIARVDPVSVERVSSADPPNGEEAARRFDFEQAAGEWKELVDNGRDVREVDFQRCAVLLLHLGRSEEFSEVITSALMRFESNPRLTMLCFLATDVEGRNRELIEGLLQNPILKTTDDYRGILAMGHFRLGDWAKADELLSAVIGNLGRRARTVEGLAFRAMARSKLERHEEARADLGKAKEKYHLMRFHPSHGVLDDSWAEKLSASLALKEALETIEGDSTWLPDIDQPIPVELASIQGKLKGSNGEFERLFKQPDPRPAGIPAVRLAALLAYAGLQEQHEELAADILPVFTRFEGPPDAIRIDQFAKAIFLLPPPNGEPTEAQVEAWTHFRRIRELDPKMWEDHQFLRLDRGLGAYRVGDHAEVEVALSDGSPAFSSPSGAVNAYAVRAMSRWRASEEQGEGEDRREDASKDLKLAKALAMASYAGLDRSMETHDSHDRIVIPHVLLREALETIEGNSDWLEPLQAGNGSQIAQTMKAEELWEKQGDGTWKLNFRGVEDLPDLALFKGTPLRSLDLRNSGITDLESLRGLPLEELILTNSKGVTDLSPLAGMPLRVLRLNGTPVTDLEPLRSMPLEELILSQCRRVMDLSPLAGMPLRVLHLSQTSVTDLERLRGMPLLDLRLNNTLVTDISLVRGMPLKKLQIRGCTRLTDLSPLADAAELESLLLPPKIGDVSFLRSLPRLERLSFTAKGYAPDRTAAQFWKQYDAGITEPGGTEKAK